VDFEAYLDGFSPNVQEILEKFKFRNQIPTMIEADILGPLLKNSQIRKSISARTPSWMRTEKSGFPRLITIQWAPFLKN